MRRDRKSDKRVDNQSELYRRNQKVIEILKNKIATTEKILCLYERFWHIKKNMQNHRVALYLSIAVSTQG